VLVQHHAKPRVLDLVNKRVDTSRAITYPFSQRHAQFIQKKLTRSLLTDLNQNDFLCASDHEVAAGVNGTLSHRCILRLSLACQYAVRTPATYVSAYVSCIQACMCPESVSHMHLFIGARMTVCFSKRFHAHSRCVHSTCADIYLSMIGMRPMA
jgi:hypothetical protein